jgi:hypothetical protein
MRIIKIDPCAELRKTPSGTHEIGVCDHASAFYVFDTCDVWIRWNGPVLCKAHDCLSILGNDR